MVRQGLIDLVAEAISTHPQDLHIAEPCTENSTLHCAVEANQYDILRMLLETRLLPVNKPNYYSRTALHLAALEGDFNAINILIEYDADLDMKDRWGDEALFLAQSNRHLEVMLELIKAGADVDKRKIDVNKLFFAVEQRDKESAKILLYQHGVDRSIQNADGVRARQIAEAAEDEGMVWVLDSAPTVIAGPGSTDLEDGGRRVVPFRARPVQL